MTMSRMMSNGSIELSSRRPTARVTTRSTKKTMTARTTMSMTGSSYGNTVIVWSTRASGSRSSSRATVASWRPVVVGSTWNWR